MPRDTVLPTRVLDVGTQAMGIVSLVESNGMRAPFVALSHRWGASHRITLTRATLDALKAGLRPDQLPKTFLDAVQITRYLGMRYLWIDSLCMGHTVFGI